MTQISNLNFQQFMLDEFKPDSSFNIIRNGQFSITHYATSDIPNSICFVTTKEYAIKASRNPNISTVITTQHLIDYISNNKGLIETKNPKKLFFEFHNLLERKYTFKNKNSVIASSAEIHHTAIIKDSVIIGDRTKIGPYCVIEEGSVIGKDVLIENHVIIGARGMHNTKINENFVNVKDLGNVIISDGCEILSHAVIQKPYFYHSTFIGKDSRISVHCDIGHGCSIGARCLIAGHSVIAGYCSLGNDIWIGPNSTVSHMTKIEDNARIIIGSVVVQDIKAGKSVSGNFAYDHTKNMRSYLKKRK